MDFLALLQKMLPSSSLCFLSDVILNDYKQDIQLFEDRNPDDTDLNVHAHMAEDRGLKVYGKSSKKPSLETAEDTKK